MPDRGTIAEFLAQPRIAVVGVSGNPKDFSRSVYRNLQSAARRLYPVTLSGAEEIEGDRCYASLTQLPDPVDGALLMIPAAASAGVVTQAIALGIPRVWLHRGSGTGSVSDDAVRLCRDHGVAVVDGACPLMFLAPVKGIHRVHRALSAGRLS